MYEMTMLWVRRDETRRGVEWGRVVEAGIIRRTRGANGRRRNQGKRNKMNEGEEDIIALVY